MKEEEGEVQDRPPIQRGSRGTDGRKVREGSILQTEVVQVQYGESRTAEFTLQRPSISSFVLFFAYEHSWVCL